MVRGAGARAVVVGGVAGERQADELDAVAAGRVVRVHRCDRRVGIAVEFSAEVDAEGEGAGAGGVAGGRGGVVDAQGKGGGRGARRRWCRR